MNTTLTTYPDKDLIALRNKRRNEHEANIYAFMNEHGPCGAKLIDCKAEGVCLVRWTRMRWTCEWFDGVEVLS